MEIEEIFRDFNGDGIPDAFENRPTITEILNADDSVTGTPPSHAASVGAANYRFSTESGLVLLEVVGARDVGVCVFRSMAELRLFVEHLTAAAQDAFPRPVKIQ